MPIRIDNNAKLHPVPAFDPVVEDLINDVYTEAYDFTEDYREVMSLRMDLYENPEEGLAELGTQYAEVQAFVSRVTNILTEILVKRSTWRIYKSRIDQIYIRARNHYFIHDVTVKSLRNKELQEAAVQERIPHIMTMMNFIDRVAADLKDLLEIVREKKDEFDKINVNINRQQKIVESLISLGYVPGIRFMKNNDKKNEERK